jgi:hypothetical protein
MALMTVCLPVLLASAWPCGLRVVAPLVLVPVATAVGLMAAWTPLAERFLGEFKVFATGAAAGLNEFSLRCSFEVPAPWGRIPVNVAALSDSSRGFGRSPNTAIIMLLGEGVLGVRFGVGTPERTFELRATNAVLAEAGRRVELTLVQSNAVSALYVDGAPVAFGSQAGKGGFAWPSRFATRYVWLGRGSGVNIIRGRIDAVTVFDRAITPEEAWSLAHPLPATPTWWHRFFSLENGETLKPGPLLNLRLRQLSPAVWVANGFGGRGQYYRDARRMLPRYPAAFGAGPGTFGSLYKVFLGDVRAVDEWYVHDDYLETRFTFGWLGSGLIYLLLASAILPVFSRGGMRLPWYFGACLALGLGGCLLHARFDFVLQTHALLFLAVLLCSVLSVSSIRRC